MVCAVYSLRRLPVPGAPRQTATAAPRPTAPRLLRAVALERFNLFAVFLYLPRPAVMAQARWGWAAQLGCTQACYAACSSHLPPLILPPVRHIPGKALPLTCANQLSVGIPCPPGGLHRAQIEADDLENDSDDDDDAEVGGRLW